MNRILSTFIFLLCFANAPLALATTITYGADFNVSSDPAFSGGFNTNIFLNEGESFGIYLGDIKYAVGGGMVSYGFDALSIFGRIEGQTLGDFFLISPTQDTFIADNTGYLFLYNQYSDTSTPRESSFISSLSVPVSSPETLLLLLGGLAGLALVGKKNSASKRAVA